MRELVSFDVECYPNYFLIGFKKLSDGKKFQIDVVGEHSSFTKEQVKTIHRILSKYTVFGYNSMDYDVPMVLKSMEQVSCLDLHDMSNDIVQNGLRNWQTMSQYQLEPLYELDHFDIQEPSPAVFISLKAYGSRLHSKKLQDLPYPFNKVLTLNEVDEIKTYNINDLDTTIDLYNAIADRIDLRIAMSKQYGTDLRSKSDAQIAETVIISELKKAKVTPSKPKMPKSVQYKAPKCITFKSEKLKYILKRVQEEAFIINPKNGSPILPDWLKDMDLSIGDTKYQIGIGGLHSKEKSLVVEPNDDEVLRNIDVASYYPSMIIEFGFYPSRLTKKFLDIYSDIKRVRLEAKRNGDKVVNEGLKIVLNGSFGKLGSMYSRLFAPELMLQVTITGQLMLLMLIEELEEVGMSVKSSNTDGVELICPKDRQDELELLVFDWELNTGMEMEHGIYKGLYARDVNNYVAVYDGYAKAKGVYADPEENLLRKNSEYPIVFTAIKEFLVHGTLLEDTIINCKDVRQFLTARAVKGGATWGTGDGIKDTDEYIEYVRKANEEYGGFGSGRARVNKALLKRNEDYHKKQVLGMKDRKYLGKVVRWYYSTNGNPIYSTTGGTVAKSQGAMPMMEIPDGNIVPDDLDYDKYVELAIGHLEDLGVKYEV